MTYKDADGSTITPVHPSAKASAEIRRPTLYDDFIRADVSGPQAADRGWVSLHEIRPNRFDPVGIVTGGGAGLTAVDTLDGTPISFSDNPATGDEYFAGVGGLVLFDSNMLDRVKVTVTWDGSWNAMAGPLLHYSPRVGGLAMFGVENLLGAGDFLTVCHVAAPVMPVTALELLAHDGGALTHVEGTDAEITLICDGTNYGYELNGVAGTLNDVSGTPSGATGLPWPTDIPFSGVHGLFVVPEYSNYALGEDVLAAIDCKIEYYDGPALV